MKIIKMQDMLYEIKEGLKNKYTACLVKYDKQCVNYGFDDKPNFDYCTKNNIECLDIGRRGGTFAINKGDIALGYITESCDNTLGELVYNKFAQYLKDKGLDAVAVSNDILIDGYKVLGWASNYYENYNAIFITLHFTMSVDLEFIKNVCTKSMNKVPKGLSEFGITEDEVINFITQTVEEYDGQRN